MIVSIMVNRSGLLVSSVFHLAIISCLVVTPLNAQDLCDSNCLTCGTTSCTTCKAGYYPSGTKCNMCGSNCKACSSSLYCTTCKDAYIPSLFGNGCDSCGTGCTSCSSTASCSKCNSGYYLTFGNFGTCSACPTGCSSCSSNLLSGSFSLSSSSSGAKCTACSAGYSIDGDKCQKKSTTGGVIGGVVGGVFFILIVAGIIYCCRRNPVVTQSTTTITSYNPNPNSTTIMYNNGQHANGVQVNFQPQPQVMGGPSPMGYGNPVSGPTPNVWGPQTGQQPGHQLGGPAPYYPTPPGFSGAQPMQPLMGQPPANHPAGALPPGFLDNNKPEAKPF